MGGDINELVSKSTLGPGTVSTVLVDMLQFDAFARPDRAAARCSTRAASSILSSTTVADHD
jgi:hypothetical protein